MIELPNRLLSFDAIEKRFHGVPVLKGVSFVLGAGRTLGLVGENGAGKSTLMNLLGGNLSPDGGRMLLDGQPFQPRDPLDAARHGVAFIHQELNLFGNLSIAENIFLTAFPKRPPWIDRRALRLRTAALLAETGLEADPDVLVESLAPGERQLVEIAKALAVRARLILFDEPTTSLTGPEAARLFALMERLRQQGVSMIYVSHHLEDVMRLCDDVVVLRDGEVVGQGPREGFTMDSLVSLMVGRQLTQLFPPRLAAPTAERVLEVEGLSQPGVVRDIRFALHRGELLGLAGLMGSGRTELARILFGLDRFTEGNVRLHGEPFQPSPEEGVRRGLAFLTENRREEGLCLEASIADNMALVGLRRYARGGFVADRALRGVVAQLREATRLTLSARDEQAVQTLSGGNQQKVVLAKWLLNKPTVFLLDEPTRGIDVGARYEVYGLIQQLAASGAGVLVISSEIEELMGLCDRILVMARGEIRDEILRADFDRERILRTALRQEPVRREAV